jgi:uncharacterized protein (TIGR02266 family)
VSDHVISDEPTFTGGNIEGGSSEVDRHQVRYGVDLAVTVNSDHNFYAGFAKNLSHGGIFVATHIIHPVGTEFNLSIHLDDGDHRVVRGIGEVRWIRVLDGDLPAGLGIQFTSVDGNGQERIERFLATRDPIVVEDAEAREERDDTVTEGGVDQDE